MPAFEPTSLELLFWEALALMVAACIFAPLFRKLGLGAILGYLVAGLVVKLSLSMSFSDHPEDLLHFAEFGVVLFLFVIGLELKPATLWSMRTDIFGLGLSQVLITGILLTPLAMMAGFAWQPALVIGLGMALSSTALVMSTLDEKRERTSAHGRKAFSILLFQDLAIVPLLLLATLLAPSETAMTMTDSFTRLAIALVAITGLILIGRFALNPLLSMLALAQMPEIMTAAALAIVIFAGLLMDAAGMSYAMGAFIAGVMLADSNYRHEIEANVEPFRGLFLGLFFMAVGLSLDIDAILNDWWIILMAAPIIMALKALTIYALARLFKQSHTVSVKTGFSLAQAGEFGFVLFGAAATSGLIAGSSSSTLIAVVTVSMALSPVFGALEKLFLQQQSERTIDETFDDAGGRALVIGFGRFGQIVSQPLLAQGIHITILDRNADRIDEACKFGFRIHFGDGKRRDVLRAAGAGKADLIIVCVDQEAEATQIVNMVQHSFPQAKIHVRSRDRGHSIRLARAQVDFSVRETFESALRMGEIALIALGIEDRIAVNTTDDIRKRDLTRLKAQIEGDLQSGIDTLHVRPVKPEPLSPALIDDEISTGA